MPPKLTFRQGFTVHFLITLFLATFILCAENSRAQTSTEFWLAPPEVTEGHATSVPIYLRLAAGATAAQVTISMPANVAGFNGGVPIVVNIPANQAQTVTLSPFVNLLETRPVNTVLNTGLKVSSTADITAVYEVSPGNNPDIWALKGLNGLGTEFYVPLQNIWPNGNYTPTPYTSFDIVATENNTTVLVYPTTTLDGPRPAFQTFSITLQAGQTYSGAVTSTVAANNPSGTAILSNKPIAVSVKDDSVAPTGAGCRDLMGDQLVPVDIVGTEYIVIRGGLTVNDGESAFLVATQNNTQIQVNGAPVGIPLFAGQTYRVPITAAQTYITGNKNFYLIHISGFGCEAGMALLPPLNCAGSEQVSFVRSTTESFFLNLLVPAGAQGGFLLNGNATLVPASAFTAVPGTGGEWVGARIEFTTAQIAAGSNYLLVNTIEPFSLGLINGGASSGCRYGYFSEFSAEIVVNAGPNQNVCANQITQLNGAISGGATQGVWSSNGTGAFQPNNTTIDAIYEPSLADLSAGVVTLTLTSVSNCFPVEDQVVINYNPAPVVNAGTDILACGNNTVVTLAGLVDIASGGIWSGGLGAFSPGPGNLNATYTPTQAEIDNGGLTLTLTSTGNGNCLAESDQVQIIFGPAPTANAGADIVVCANNATVTLNGSVTVAGGGQWSGGSGGFTPSNQALGASYTPSNGEILSGSVILTLTTTNNGGCTAVTDQVLITFTDAPVVNAGSDQFICRNNANIPLNGNIVGATGGMWSTGSGTFDPNPNTLNAVYTPSITEFLAGSVTLTLTSQGNGNCAAVSDQVTFTFTNPPVVNPGPNANVCINNPTISLNGSLTGAFFGLWGGGMGGYSPNPTNLSAVYTPTAGEIAAGFVTLTLTSLDNGNCLPVTESVTYTFTPAPVVNAGPNQSICKNNPDVTLAGSVTVAGGGIWSGGGGSFTPNNTTLNAVYTPTTAELNANSVTLTLTSTNNANCTAVSDQVTINFTPAPTANAGSDVVVCANNANVNLTGSVTVATGGTWSGGLGNYSNGANSLITTYSPTSSEIAAGSLTLTLTTSGNNNCSAVTDNLLITFTPAPTVEAGPSISVCSNNAQVSLAGSVTVSGGGAWSGGLGGYVPNANTLNALYNPTPAEIASGSLALTLTSTGNGTCSPVTDFVNITFTPAPTVNAGANVTVCANSPVVNLNGSINLATGATWSGGSGSFNPSPTALGAAYTPSAAEIAAGIATLTLTTTGNANCNAVADQMVITITPAPTVNAGMDNELCANNAAIQLNGVVTTATGGSWSGGNGSYSPNSNTLITTYTPSTGEINNGSVTLTLTSTGNGSCVAVTDQVTYTFSPSPTVNAGANQTLCANNAEAVLNGSVTVATGGTWSGGAGNFSPNPNSLNVFYTPTPEEIALGSVVLTLTSTGNDDCNAVSGQVTINFTPAPTTNAGLDRTVCANNPNVTLNGSVTVATGGTWSGGTGTFDPAPNVLGAIYTPSAAEILAGTVTLTLTTSGNGTCLAVTDQMVITITPAPTVNAGVGEELCSNNPAITLNGSVTTATGGSWTGGNGSYVPNSNALNAVYTPSNGEINNGFVTLTLTSTGNGTCTSVTDQVTYTFGPSPTADAGANQTLCSNNAVISLNGGVTIATGGTWSGGAGSYNPNANNLNALYTPSPAEITSGSVTLTLTTTGNDDCNAVSDQVIFNFTPSPTANAGSDRTVCANSPEVTLSGSISISTGGQWSGGTGTFTPSSDILNPTYTPSAAEITAGNVTLTLTTTGNGTCNPVTDQMVITITPAPTVEAGVGDELCANNAAIQLNGAVTTATGGSWSGGNGSYAPNSNTLNAVYTPSNGEISNGFVTLTLTSTGNGSCVPVSDVVTFTFSPAPTAEAGPNQTLCANNAEAQLNGSVTVATGGTWSGGAGNFSPNANSLNSFYTPTPEEIALGSVVLILTTTGNDDCNAVSDQVIINFTPAPTANAGLDRTVCANNPNVTLNGSVTVATGGTWTGGSGTFDPAANVLGATYTPSAAEITAGTVTLTLTTTGFGNCNPVSDQMVITITPAPTVEAGIGEELCANNPAITLNGSVTIATGGSWTGGNGSYLPNSNALNAVYTPSNGEINNGFVTLTLTSTGNGSCTAVTDQVTYTFGPSPTADAGVNQILCSNNAVISLNGSVTVSTGGSWSGGAGSYNPNANTLNALYTPSPAEITSGSVTLTLTTTGNDECNAVSDQVTFNFTPSPTANAGSDRTVCANAPEVALSGSISIATGGIWSGGTGSFTPSNDILNPTYTPSAADIAAGTVTLTLTTTGNGTCNQVTDQMVITITPAPTVNAGTDNELCANNAAIQLNGIVTTATGGSWSGGNGSYSPNSNTLITTYTPSNGEINNGSVTLTLTSTGNGSCVAVTDQVTYTFSPAPTVTAGTNQTLCANNAEAQLNGLVTVATGGTWSGGAGNFSPSVNSLNAFYTPTPEEIASGNVVLTLTTTGNDDCNAVSSQVTLTFTPAPTANAGLDRTVCANNPTVNLNGSVTVATGGTWSGGSGTFDPAPNVLNAIYTPSAAEIAAGTVTLSLSTIGNGTCNQVVDQMVITINPEPVVNAGNDFSVCSNNNIFNLNGSVLNAGGGQWSGGLGIYNSGPTDLTATYTPTLPEVVSGSITFTLTSTGNAGCIAVTDQVVVTFTPAPTANAGIDVTTCASSPAVALNGSFTVSPNAQWSGGLGSFSPNALAMNASYNPTPAEIASGSVTLTLTTISNGNCLAASDQMTITYNPLPSVSAGGNLVSCANNAVVSLNGSFNNSQGVIWSGGTGFFNPSNQDPNATYTPSTTEITNGFVALTLTTTGNGACTPASSTMNITINPAPVVNAGLDFSVCANNTNAQLAGSVNFANGGVWSGGAGSFSPNPTTLNATYQPTPAEVTLGFVNLTLTSSGNGTCLAVTDQVTINFTPAPVVGAGTDRIACENNAVVQLNGSFTVAEGANWSGGGGSFNPGSNVPNALYTPSQNELAAGSVTLTLTSFGNGNCLPVSDQMTITYTPQPVVNAGEDIFACVDALSIPLSGSVTGPTGSGVWSTSGTGVFVPNQFNLNASYNASAQDSLLGGVTLTLTSTNNGSCNAVTDQLSIFINPAGTANAGPDRSVCANNTAVPLTGIIGGAASTGFWTTSGSGAFSPNETSLNVTYIPSPADVAAGTVTVTFSVNSCNQASDDVVITITPAPVVNAGPDLTTCSSEMSIALNGQVSGASGTGIWTTTGSGSFSPNANALNASYVFSPADIAAQNVQLTLSATGIGNCIGVSDQLNLNIFPQGTVEVGNNIVACANNPEAQLSVSLTGASQGIWSSNGTGTFAPEPTSLNATYVPSPGDLVNGTVNLVFTATNSCNLATDFLTLSFTPAPVVNAGADQAICDEVLPFTINGTVANAGGAQWSTTGTGVFQNANNLNTFYVASQADINAGGVYLLLTSTGNGTCFPVVDTLQIEINSGVIANAGPDREACIDAGQIQLFGTVSNGTNSGMWSTSGNGTFSPNANSVNAVYNFTPQDIAGESVILTLTSTNNGICQADEDSFVLTFGTSAFVYAGEDVSVCQTAELIQLNGQVSGETNTGTWTSTGTGTFFPSANSLNASYEPSAADISAGNISLTLTSTNSTLCVEGSDALIINFQANPTANANADVLVCGAIAPVQLLGSVNGSTGGIWSTSGSGTFQPNDSVLTALYTPTAADSLIGNVTLTLTTYGNGNCTAGTDQMTISFSGAVVPNAGSDIEVCETTGSVPLSGSTDGPGSTTWTSSGSGTFSPNNTTLSTNYLPGEADAIAGFVWLYLSVEGNGSCPGRTDSLRLNFDRLPVIDVVSSVQSCTTNPAVAITSNVSFEDALLWTSTGTGTFSPSTSATNIVYTPSATEVAAGFAMLTLTATSNGACGSVAEMVTVTIIAPATVNAGTDLTLCASEGSAQLQGQVQGPTQTGVWSTNSFGSFSPDTETLDGTYIFGATDIIVGFAQLTLTSTNNGPCPAVSDAVVFTINPVPVINAGANQFVCASAGTVDLAGTANNAASTTWSSIGDGVFLPGPGDLITSYIVGNLDVSNGSVALILTANGLPGCASVSDTMMVDLSNPLIAGFSVSPACAGSRTQFTDQTEVLAGNIISWSWDFGNGNISNQQNPEVIFSATGSYNVRLIARSSLGCNDTLTQIVNVTASPTASFLISDNPAPLNFDVRFEDTSNGAVSWQWYFGDGFGESVLQNPSYAYTVEGNYLVSLVVTGEGGCQDSISRPLNIDGYLVLPPRLPNTFSPNNDGMNDIYFVRGGPFLEMDFRVYDGWGSQIFKSTSQDVGWNGTEGGKQSPTGVYVYTIKATNLSGQSYDYSGRINLLR